MSEGAIGFLILIGVSTLAALLCHWLSTGYLVPSLCAAIVASIAFGFIACLHSGFQDPLFVIALMTSGFIAFVVALIIGLPFRARRIQSEREQSIRTTILSDLKSADDDSIAPNHVIEANRQQSSRFGRTREDGADRDRLEAS